MDGYAPLGILDRVVYNNPNWGSLTPTRELGEKLGLLKGSYDLDCNSKVSCGNTGEGTWADRCWNGFGPFKVPNPNNMLVIRGKTNHSNSVADRFLRRFYDKTRGEVNYIEIVGHPGANNMRQGYSMDERSFDVRGPDGNKICKRIGLAHFAVHVHVVTEPDLFGPFFEEILGDEGRAMKFIENLHASYRGKTVDLYRGFGFDDGAPYHLDVSPPADL